MISAAALLAIAAGASLQAARPTPRAPLVVTRERILAEPGPVLRAQSLIGAPALAAGVSVTFACKLGTGGRLEDCAPTGGAPGEWDEIAARRLPGYRISVGDLGLKWPEKIAARITIPLAPADRREIALTGPIAADTAQLTFTTRASNRVAQAFYPITALRNEIELNIALACRVLGGGSLFCPEGAVAGELPERAKASPAVVDNFIFAAQQVTGMMRVAPALKDGRPSEGHQFRMVVAFRMQSY